MSWLDNKLLPTTPRPGHSRRPLVAAHNTRWVASLLKNCRRQLVHKPTQWCAPECCTTATCITTELQPAWQPTGRHGAPARRQRQQGPAVACWQPQARGLPSLRVPSTPCSCRSSSLQAAATPLAAIRSPAARTQQCDWGPSCHEAGGGPTATRQSSLASRHTSKQHRRLHHKGTRALQLAARPQQQRQQRQRQWQSAATPGRKRECRTCGACSSPASACSR